MRIARALALAGIDSRRKCEEHVRNGAITLNGEVVRDLGRQINLEEDALCFRGRLLAFERPIYYLLYKPEGYLTTAENKAAKKTVYDLLPPNLIRGSRQQKMGRTRVFPVGRLDKDSSGLLLFTNDGELANRLMHPRYGVGKLYEARLNRAVDERDLRRLLQGVRLEDGMARAEKLVRVSPRIVRLLIREGRNREVRRMFEAVRYEVVKLCRLALGPLTIQGMRLGQGRFLKYDEIQMLRKAVGADSSHS